jgi:predicted nucleotidyltransferase
MGCLLYLLRHSSINHVQGITLNEAIQIITNEIASVLADNKPTIYLFGSVVLDDFQLGWSDIVILVLTKCEITGQQAETLVRLRQALLGRYLDNPYFCLFEGGMLSKEVIRALQTLFIRYSGLYISIIPAYSQYDNYEARSIL